MDIKANLVEWMELLSEMLQFLDATASAEMCNSPGKAIAMNGRRREERHPQCGAAAAGVSASASASADVVKCEEKCDWCPLDPKESAEYMNIVNKIDESHRLTLIHKCNVVLGKLHEWLLASMLEPLSSSSSSPLKKELDGVEDDEDEENSYLEMGGVGHKNDINLTEPTDKIDSCEIFEKDDAAGGGFLEVDPAGKNEEELNLEENCYDFTTDRSLYDDCSSDMKLNNVACVIPVDEDDSKCPFSGLPAVHLRIKQSPKFGTLFRHEKRLFFDQTKKFYVGLLDRWLLLYNNCNELKPAQCVYVKDLKLDLNLNDQFNEKHQFHIITQNDSKICFLSPSFKELNEWIVALEQSLLTKTDNTATNSSRKLPLPPTPDDEPDNNCLAGNDHVDHTDSIYEEPQLLHKQHGLAEQSQQHGYDTPKPSIVDVCSHNHQSQQHSKTSPTKIINDVLISPTTTPRANKCEPISHTVVPTVATNISSPASPVTPTTPTSTTPVKSWLFNRFHKSASSDGNGTSSSSTEHSKHTRKAHSSKKLSFQQEHIPDVIAKPPPCNSVKSTGNSNSSNNCNSTSPASAALTVPSAAGKGTKINMIISQLEANGQLSLLSKSLNDPTKRNTLCVED
nr:LOW QUALITY PROTEIN: uncharacterized protein LOC109411217 [Aedes albopictus]